MGSNLTPCLGPPPPPLSSRTGYSRRLLRRTSEPPLARWWRTCTPRALGMYVRKLVLRAISIFVDALCAHVRDPFPGSVWYLLRATRVCAPLDPSIFDVPCVRCACAPSRSATLPPYVVCRMCVFCARHRFRVHLHDTALFAHCERTCDIVLFVRSLKC